MRRLYSQPETRGGAVLTNRYDDGGFSGGTMERPALKRLVSDIQARKIDTIVVYKVDRLTNSSTLQPPWDGSR